MTLNVNIPVPATKIKDIPTIFPQNWAAIDGAMSLEHFSLASTAEAGRHNPGIAGFLLAAPTSALTAMGQASGAMAFDTTIGAGKTFAVTTCAWQELSYDLPMSRVVAYLSWSSETSGEYTPTRVPVSDTTVAFTSYSGANPYLFQFGSQGYGNGQFYNPTGLTEYNDEIYVIEESPNFRVQVFNLLGEYQRQWGSHGTGDGKFQSPTGITSLGSEIYICDSNSPGYDIQVFNSAGVFQRKWGSFGTGDGQFEYPGAINSYGSEIYVADTANHRIQVFNSTGVFQRKWGTDGSGNGNLHTPGGLTIYNNEVYVSDSGNNRIQVFDLSGTYKRQWGTFGGSDGQFKNPVGISIYGGEVFVVDTANYRIQVFDLSGTYKRQWGTGAYGQFELPMGITILSSDGTIYILDSYYDTVQVFSGPTSNYENVDGYPSVNDAAYNYTAGVNSDWLGINSCDVPTNAIITNVEMYIRAKTSAPGVNLAIALMVGTATFSASTNITLTTGFVEYVRTWTTNPTTHLAWTPSEINALTGLCISALNSGPTVYYSRVYLKVTYTIPIQTVTPGVSAGVIFGATQLDQLNEFNTSTNIFCAHSEGYYLVLTQCTIASIGGGKTTLAVSVCGANGVETIRSTDPHTAESTEHFSRSILSTYPLSSADCLAVQLINSGLSGVIIEGGSERTFLIVYRLS